MIVNLFKKHDRDFYSLQSHIILFNISNNNLFKLLKLKEKNIIQTYIIYYLGYFDNKDSICFLSLRSHLFCNILQHKSNKILIKQIL